MVHWANHHVRKVYLGSRKGKEPGDVERCTPQGVITIIFA
jgi:hypothetical protein